MPLVICGRGSIVIGDRNAFGYSQAIRAGNGEVMLQARAAGARILIGSENSFSNNVSLVAQGLIQVGNRCLIGDGVTIYDCDFHEIHPSRRHQGVGPILPVIIGTNVWIGSRVVILKGVTIGDNSVIGAMSLVASDVPPNSVASGNPAKVIRHLGAGETRRI